MRVGYQVPGEGRGDGPPARYVPGLLVQPEHRAEADAYFRCCPPVAGDRRTRVVVLGCRRLLGDWLAAAIAAAVVATAVTAVAVAAVVAVVAAVTADIAVVAVAAAAAAAVVAVAAI